MLACVAVAALPGPSTALFLHRTVRDGRKAGLAAVAGNEIGVFCWALSRATVRRRMERALGATLVCLGIDLAAATR